MNITMSAPNHQQPAKDRSTFTVQFRPEPDVEDPIRALRMLLKAALRRFGLRAIDAHDDGDRHG
jgi:hypothetical protein